MQLQKDASPSRQASPAGAEATRTLEEPIRARFWQMVHMGGSWSASCREPVSNNFQILILKHFSYLNVVSYLWHVLSTNWTLVLSA